MSLDLTKVASQVLEMITKFRADGEERQKHLEYALEVLHDRADDIDSLKKKIISSKTTWLVANIVDGLDQHNQPSPLPADFTVIATDGSHIDVDRHQSTRCYLINIGSVLLHYGTSPEAVLDSVPSLYTAEEDLVITPTGDSRGRGQPVEGSLLGIKRGVDECQQLAQLASELPSGDSTLALLDGSLILWGLEAYPEFVTEVLLDKGFLRYLEEMRSIKDKKLALASYISFPRSTDVVNVLRVAICPHEIADCDKYCPANKPRDCEMVSGVRDRDLFTSILEQGERSELFISPSKIQKRYGEHQVYFFYLKVDDEIARIEIPQWVARDDSLLNLTHSLVLDQCWRGQGYPVALSEAHEQAVVTMSDRGNFWQLVESSLVGEKLPAFTSAKSRSKKTKWV
ncbi:DNA double-strand break repair nuclease NurA [Chloroflexota bacterium]